MLEFTNIRKCYNKNLALEIPSLQLEKGIFWLKGANGSGKTTFLKLVAGLLPFDGDISFNKISLKSKPVKYRQNVSWAEAEPLFPSFMTGNELLLLYKNIRMSKQADVDFLVELFDMAGYVNKNIGSYSAGMSKKLSLVLAFIGNTPLIVLDEPLITLDADALNKICNLIKERNKDVGTTFLLSSHHDLDIELVFSSKQIIVNNKSVIVE